MDIDRWLYGLTWSEVLILMSLGSLGRGWHTPTEVRRQIQSAANLSIVMTSPDVFKVLMALNNRGFIEGRFVEEKGVGERLQYQVTARGWQRYHDVKALKAAGFFD